MLAKSWILTVLSFAGVCLNVHAEVSPPYYQNLLGQCQGNECCLRSVETMKQKGAVLPGGNQSCFQSWMLQKLPCENSLTWCEKDPLAMDEADRSPLTAKEYLAAKQKCSGNNCCLGSLETAYRKHYPLAKNGVCGRAHSENRNRCIGSLVWCEPVPTK